MGSEAVNLHQARGKSGLDKDKSVEKVQNSRTQELGCSSDKKPGDRICPWTKCGDESKKKVPNDSWVWGLSKQVKDEILSSPLP